MIAPAPSGVGHRGARASLVRVLGALIVLGSSLLAAGWLWTGTARADGGGIDLHLHVSTPVATVGTDVSTSSDSTVSVPAVQVEAETPVAAVETAVSDGAASADEGTLEVATPTVGTSASTPLASTDVAVSQGSLAAQSGKDGVELDASLPAVTAKASTQVGSTDVRVSPATVHASLARAEEPAATTGNVNPPTVKTVGGVPSTVRSAHAGERVGATRRVSRVAPSGARKVGASSIDGAGMAARSSDAPLADAMAASRHSVIAPQSLAAMRGAARAGEPAGAAVQAGASGASHAPASPFSSLVNVFGAAVASGLTPHGSVFAAALLALGLGAAGFAGLLVIEQLRLRPSRLWSRLERPG